MSIFPVSIVALLLLVVCIGAAGLAVLAGVAIAGNRRKE